MFYFFTANRNDSIRIITEFLVVSQTELCQSIYFILLISRLILCEMYPNIVINVLIYITDKYKGFVEYAVLCRTTYEDFGTTKLLKH